MSDKKPQQPQKPATQTPSRPKNLTEEVARVPSGGTNRSKNIDFYEAPIKPKKK